MTKTPKKGDKVAWKTSQGETHGVVAEIVTQTKTIKGHTAKATKAAPQVLVRSAKTGKEAIHKPDSLKPDP